MHLYIARLLAETPCQASPDKSADCPPAPAASTAAPLGRPGFVVICRLTQTRQPLVCGIVLLRP